MSKAARLTSHLSADSFTTTTTTTITPSHTTAVLLDEFLKAADEEKKNMAREASHLQQGVMVLLLLFCCCYYCYYYKLPNTRTCLSDGTALDPFLEQLSQFFTSLELERYIITTFRFLDANGDGKVCMCGNPTDV